MKYMRKNLKYIRNEFKYIQIYKKWPPPSGTRPNFCLGMLPICKRDYLQMNVRKQILISAILHTEAN